MLRKRKSILPFNDRKKSGEFSKIESKWKEPFCDWQFVLICAELFEWGHGAILAAWFTLSTGTKLFVWPMYDITKANANKNNAMQCVRVFFLFFIDMV